MTHRYAVGAYVTFRDPDEKGRLTDGSPMPCRVLEHLASDVVGPLYVVNEGNVYDQRYELIAREWELIACEPITYGARVPRN